MGFSQHTLSDSELNNIITTANADGTVTSFGIGGISGLNDDSNSNTIITNSNNEFFLTITLDNPLYLNKIVVNSAGDADGFQIYTIFLGQTEDSNNFETLIDVTSDAGNGNVEYEITQPNPDPIKYKTVQIKFNKTSGEGALGFDNTSTMRIDAITLYTIDNPSEYYVRDYNVEFDDSLLDMASWNNARYDGCKISGSRINVFTEGDPIYPYGLKPIIENKTCAIFIGNSIEQGEVTSSLDPLVDINNHSYVTIDTILLVDLQTLKSTKITHEQFNETENKKESFRRLVADNFPEGSKIVTKLLDIATAAQLKEFHHVKFNQGLLMKLYSYTANTDGKEDGVFGGFGVRDEKGVLIDNAASGGGLFGFGTTVATSASLFGLSTQTSYDGDPYTTIDEFPSELSLYGNIGNITHLSPATASGTPTSDRFAYVRRVIE